VPFRIRALPIAPFAPLFDLSEDELRRRRAVRVVADRAPGFPCRVSLRDAEPGETVLLLNYEHQSADSPYRAGHAIYVRAGAVVPFNLRTATASWWGLNDLDVAGKAGFLVTNKVKLALTGQPRDVQLFVPSAKRPTRVTLAGKRVAWTWNDAPLPGAVIRLHGPVIRGQIVLVGA
jgi:hypothetical protein